MFKRLRNVFLVGLALVLVASVIRFLTTPQQASTTGTTATPQVVKVDKGDVAVTVSAIGTIEANQTVSLAFASTGTVKTINVTAGTYVRKGQTIATLDATSATDALLLAQAAVDAKEIALKTLTDKPRQVDIDVYEASLSVAKAQLKEASSTGSKITEQINALKVEQAKNTLWQTELTRDANDQKKEQLLKDSRTANQAASLPTAAQNNANIKSSDYDVLIAQANLAASKSSGASVSSMASAQASVTSAQVALDNLLNGGDKDDVAKAQAELKAVQHSLDSAKTALSQMTLTAPFDGVVTEIALHIGETAPTSDAVVMLDTSSFYVDVPVDEADIAQVAVGQSVTLSVDALTGVKLTGKLERIATTSTLSGNVVTYTVRITIDPAGHALRSAMSTTATIITQQAQNTLRVPNSYVTTDSTTGKSTVYVRQADGTIKAVTVVIGIRNGTYTEIKSGLDEGDELATASIVKSSGTTTSNQGGGPGGIPGIGGAGMGGPPPGR